MDIFNLNIVSIDPERILSKIQLAAVNPARQNIWAIGNKVLRLGPCFTMCFNCPLGHWICDPHTSNGGEITSLALKGELNSVVIQSNNAEVIDGQFFRATVDFSCILDNIKNVGIVRGSRRVYCALDAINNIMSGNSFVLAVFNNFSRLSIVAYP